MAKKRKRKSTENNTYDNVRGCFTLLDSGVILTKKDSSLNDCYEYKLIEVNGKVLEEPINVEFKFITNDIQNAHER